MTTHSWASCLPLPVFLAQRLSTTSTAYGGYSLSLPYPGEVRGLGRRIIKEAREGSERYMTLKGEQHSFMHDLESLFWVLFWIGIHYNGPDKDIGSTAFDAWNYQKDETLAHLKLGIISTERSFLKALYKHFTSYYQPLIPLMNNFRKAVFPDGNPWEKDDLALYATIKSILTQGSI